ncbi:V4R domain-containing protein [Methanobacterium formicicum]|uniref:ArsR family transcriptional regulator n=1 Tax=Methanobacterium formicicum (strain DSM 3637 / PP1) TaxID=1204725 RepID=K2R2Y3_METFP|nr:V4R domain-containing protein [Methanobacterium formicicum]EKF86868.1 ArsR family transcriptional regulator [Methanobacterium formicicum DSM 3637]
MANINTESRIKIFSTKTGVNVVQSPIKAQILSILKEGGMSGSQIVSSTKRSKSTISAHLQDLEDAGIIDWVIDPEDRRRKIYYINSKFLGDLSSTKEIENDMNDLLEEYVVQSEDPFNFFRFMFRAIRVALLDEGINIDPILHNAGVKVGKTFYKKLKGQDVNELTRNIAVFWEANKLGNIQIKSMNPIIIQAYDCFECEDLPQLGRPACAFDSGLLEGVFSNYYGQEVEAEETKCYAQGDDFCQFVIKPLKSKE